MSILTTDIVYRLSGGAANADPTLSIGGVKSSVASGSTIFDDVSSVEAAAGDVEYRLVYIHNGHATLAYQTAAVDTDPDAKRIHDVAIGLAAAGLNATETAVANENTAPASVTFSAPSTFGAGLSLGTIPAGQHYGVWVRRTINAGAASAADSFTLRVQGDSNP